MLASRLAETKISGYVEEREQGEEKPANKKKFASKMRSIVSAVKTAQRLEVETIESHQSILSILDGDVLLIDLNLEEQ